MDLDNRVTEFVFTTVSPAPGHSFSESHQAGMEAVHSELSRALEGSFPEEADWGSFSRRQLVTFGKFDALVQYQLPHISCCSYLRSAVACTKPFGEQISIPTIRLVKLGSPEWTESPFYAVTFLEINAGHSRGKSVQDVVAALPHCSAFLTFSTTFPLVVTASFQTFESFVAHVANIRDISGIKSTATILCIDMGCSSGVPSPVVGIRLKIIAGREPEVFFGLDALFPLGAKTVARAGYWDASATVQGEDLATLIEAIVDHVPKLPVVEVSTVLRWDDTRRTPLGEQRSSRPPRDTHPPLEVLSMPRATLDRTDRLLVRRYSSLHTLIRWMYAQFLQIVKAWPVVEGQPGRETIRALDAFFQAAENDIVTGRRIAAQRDSFAIPEEGRAYEARAWNVLVLYERHASDVKEILHRLVTEISSRTQAIEVVSSTEPSVRSGERTEVTDLFPAVANLLMSEYLSRWDLQGGMDFGESLWTGVVVSSNHEPDLRIYNKYHMLCVPNQMKVTDSAQRLMQIGHEAAHELLSVLNRRRDSAATRDLHGIAQKTLNGARGECQAVVDQLRESKTASSTVVDDLQKLALCLSPLTSDERKEAQRKMQLWTTQQVLPFELAQEDLDPLPEIPTDQLLWDEFWRNEVVVDVLSFLSGGPAAVRALALLDYRNEGFGQTHIPIWLRLDLGQRILTMLEIPWGPWNESLAEAWLEIVARERRRGPLLGSILAFLDSGEVDATLAGSAALTSKNLYILRSLLSNNGTIVRELVRWSAKYAADYLFYSTSPPSDNAVDKVNDRCSAIVKSMGSGAIQPHGRLREVAAAATIASPACGDELAVLWLYYAT